MHTLVCLGEIVFVYKYDLTREEVPGGDDVVDESLDAEAVDERSLSLSVRLLEDCPMSRCS